MNLEIKALPTEKSKIDLTQNMKGGYIPAHPFRMFICGASGSGKTQLMLNMLTRPQFYQDYFDVKHTFIISATAGHLDDTYKVLNGMPKSNFIHPDVGPEAIEFILSQQEELIEKNGIGKKTKKLLFILDDCASFDKFLKSKPLQGLLFKGRHLNCSTIITSQAYHRIPKNLRLNMSSLMYFKGSEKENQVVIDDYCPGGLNTKQFKTLIETATGEKYQFLYINLHQPVETRFKKNFTETLTIEDFK